MDEQTYDVLLTADAYGGEAFGRLDDGRAVFVPYALAGDKVRVRLFDEKPRFARGEIVDVLQPSGLRTRPRCVHFGVCGGCHYQHIQYPHQLEMKRAIVIDQLQRIAGIENPPVTQVTPSPLQYEYRNHVQFHLDPDGKPGYHRNRSNTVVPVQECHLPVSELQNIWQQMEFETGTGIERIGVRAGSFGDLQVILEGEYDNLPELSVEDLEISVTHLSSAGLLVLAGSPAVAMQVRGRTFRVLAGSFFQVNLPVAEAMLDYVLAGAAAHRVTTALDLYAGVGLFSAFLAQRVEKLVAVESSPSACEDFSVNLDEFENVELYEAPVEAVLPGLDFHPDLVVADPPRAGLGRDVIAGLERMAPSVIVYISCDPATMARDARNLAQAGYRLLELKPFDMFPQTFHIETIGIWSR